MSHKGPRAIPQVGHSARELYRTLYRRSVSLQPKPFAMGFRIEHPQAYIDELQYGRHDAAAVMRGKGRLPVADYSLVANVLDGGGGGLGDSASRGGCDAAGVEFVEGSDGGSRRDGERGGTASLTRGVYSFCMCPGGQIVPTSTSESELCINGMSFSRRNSEWANSALVVEVRPADWAHLEQEHGALAGMELQREIERAGAAAGGGRFVAPVQLAADFLDGRWSPAGTPAGANWILCVPIPQGLLGVQSMPKHDATFRATPGQSGPFAPSRIPERLLAQWLYAPSTLPSNMAVD